jgi:hypothetical protein
MSLKLKFDILTGEFERRMIELEKPIAETATAAMDEVLRIVKSEGRASIASAGFSRRWQNTLRVDRYPKKKNSMSAAVYVHHRIPYAGVFEEGATIRGNPLMWVRLPTTPKKVAGVPMTPLNYELNVGDLVSFKSKTGTPLLGATVRVAKGRKDTSKVSLSLLRRGKNLGGRGVLRTIPLFFGIRSTKIEKKFNITQICENARNSIPSIYARLFRGD